MTSREVHDDSSLVSQVEHALKLSNDYALGLVHPDGHWYGEMNTNVTVTAEYIFLRQALGLYLKADVAAYCHYLLSQQNSDGSWGLAPEYPGDVSTSTEAYLALKILGTSPHIPAMQNAREFVLKTGGIARVRVFTRILGHLWSVPLECSTRASRGAYASAIHLPNKHLQVRILGSRYCCSSVDYLSPSTCVLATEWKVRE